MTKCTKRDWLWPLFLCIKSQDGSRKEEGRNSEPTDKDTSEARVIWSTSNQESIGNYLMIPMKVCRVREGQRGPASPQTVRVSAEGK
mmetsp:Transcript_33543/g.77335  ORF Transcript_33543/g.77335 Transcript_33543/m.77335 type:complete len:87 (+) Transcript_33543:62-322(+)